jgi:hypothetical protein
MLADLDKIAGTVQEKIEPPGEANTRTPEEHHIDEQEKTFR